jgi:protein-disulfide isomerase
MKQSITQYLMVILLVIGAYFLGVYKTKTEYLEKGVQVAGTQTTQTDQTAQQKTPATVDLAKIKEKFDGKHITFGDKDAKLVIAEVSDPSCPYCHIAGGLHPELNNSSPQFKMVKDGGTYQPPVLEIEKLVKEGKASFIFLYAPGHGSGEVGTQAMYCAYEQGKFWEAHNALMTKAGYDLLNNVVKNDLTQSAKVVALIGRAVDSNKLQSCLDSKKYENQPAEDTAFVQSLGFGATPTFFVNSTVIEGAQSWTAFKATVDSLL